MPTDDLDSKAAGFSIRPAINQDRPEILRVLYTVRLEYDVVHTEKDVDASLADIEANYFAGGGCFEVLEDSEGRIMGCAGLRPLNQRRAELCKMYLEKAVRGRGLGRRLLEDMLAAARRGGFTEVWLETNSRLLEATSLYLSYGFRPVAPDHLLSKCDRAYLLQL